MGEPDKPLTEDQLKALPVWLECPHKLRPGAIVRMGMLNGHNVVAVTVPRRRGRHKTLGMYIQSNDLDLGILSILAADDGHLMRAGGQSHILV